MTETEERHPRRAATSSRPTSAAAAAGTAAMSFLPERPRGQERHDQGRRDRLRRPGHRRGGNICEAAGTSYNIKIHALGDVFEDRVNNCYEALKEQRQAPATSSTSTRTAASTTSTPTRRWSTAATW